MLKFNTIRVASLLRKSAWFLSLTAIAFLGFASSGGGDGKRKSKLSFDKDFVPVRTSGGFTLKSGPSYKGSRLLNYNKQKDAVHFTSVVTYQKGNTTYILPYKNKMQVPGKLAGKNNLNAVNLKIKLGK